MPDIPQPSEPEWIDTPESSMISRFMYEPASAVLTVEFNNGDTYDYRGVPRLIYEAFRSASSKGRFLNSQIKGRYAH